MIRSIYLRRLFITQFVVMIGLFFYLGIANVSGTAAENINDLFLHASGYFVAIFSGFLAFYSLKRFSVVIFFLWLFSILIELIQYFLPWRSFSLLDILANSSGLLLGFIVLQLIKQYLLRFIKTISH